ncbi:hypothetical protein GBF38_005702 [Nibea albiflora]|uniref:Uncharacterized protein n=1 Tax=Nibea albiflora TaxID=240163 RepID=A0ACB7F967_NIBAL|nr:hypothetical protein GBF38_005702 [Nibea albiflora]
MEGDRSNILGDPIVIEHPMGPHVGDARPAVDIPLVGDGFHVGAARRFGHPLGFRPIFGHGALLVNPDGDVVQLVVNPLLVEDERRNDEFQWWDEFSETDSETDTDSESDTDSDDEEEQPASPPSPVPLPQTPKRQREEDAEDEEVRSKRMRSDESCDQEISDNEFRWWDEFADTDSETESDTEEEPMSPPSSSPRPQTPKRKPREEDEDEYDELSRKRLRT